MSALHPLPTSDRTSVLGRRVTVLGLGRREGVSLAHFLHAEGASVLVSDHQSTDKLEVSLAGIAGIPVELDLGGHDADRILGWSDLICVSPVIPRSHPLLQAATRRGIPLSSEVELFFERCPAPIIGITGSAGKTTVTTLLGEMLAAAGRDVRVGGNIGRPLLQELRSISAQTAVVMELSSFQLQPLRRSPHGAVVTNVTPNHLDRHADMAEYAAAKRNIVQHQCPDDWAVLNAGDPVVRGFAGSTPGATAWYSRDAPAGGGVAGAFVRNGDLVLNAGGRTRALFPMSSLMLRGTHNQENVLAACLAAALAGVPDSAMANVATSFAGVPHRLQLVGQVGGARCYNDSIATSPERLLAAIRSFDEPLVVIAGGRDKHLPWETAAEMLSRRAHHVVVTGEAANRIGDAIEAAASRTGRRPSVQRCPTFDEAVLTAVAAARPGDVVLLSPGCASFDQFIDFAARGDRFAALVAAASSVGAEQSAREEQQ